MTVGSIEAYAFRIGSVVLLLALVGVLVSRGGSRGVSSVKLADPHGVALTLDDLPGFVVTPSTAPVARAVTDACPPSFSIPDPRTTPLPERCDFTGFLTASAIDGAGREQLDAYTRETGNTPNPLLPLPIAGPFVATHSGIFEVYDWVVVLPSSVDAQDEFARMAHSRADQLSDYRELPSSLGDERRVYRGVFGPPATYETQIVTFWRRGDVVAMLNTMGAADISEDQHTDLVRIVDARMQAIAQQIGRRRESRPVNASAFR